MVTHGPILMNNSDKSLGRVIASLNLALGPDCGAGWMEVNGRRIEKHSKTRHNYIVWWKRLQEQLIYLSTRCSSPNTCVGEASVCAAVYDVSAVSSVGTFLISSQCHQRRQEIGCWPTLWRLFRYSLAALLHQRSRDVDALRWTRVSCRLQHNRNRSPASNCARWRNDPSSFLGFLCRNRKYNHRNYHFKLFLLYTVLSPKRKVDGRAQILIQPTEEAPLQLTHFSA